METSLNSFKNKSDIKPLPFYSYFTAVAFLSMSGVLVSLYLSFSHYKVYTDIGYKSFCAISSAINCDTVSQSPFAIMLGMPLAVWGTVGYLFFLVILGFARQPAARPERFWALLVLISAAFSAHSVYLAWLSTFKIHSYCIMCLGSYGINFAILFYSDLIRRRFQEVGFFQSLKRDIRHLYRVGWRFGAVMGLLTLAVIILWSAFPSYWGFEAAQPSATIANGITEEGHPWIGAREPELVITEYTDYQCFQCKKMHYFLRQLIASNPTKIRLVHRHFPMDDEVNPLVKAPFHVGSGKLALLAIYATDQGKFWRVNDALFQLPKDDKLDLRKFSELVEIDASDLARALMDRNNLRKLRADISTALKLEITGTPAFVIDGKPYIGTIPEKVLADILE
jgi:protein-disulfide isomerase/uncharacterized membrane protein